MNAHTPGPWFAVQYNRSAAWRVTTSPSDAHGDIANVLAGLAARKDADVAANAKLIAAAPKLLEALQGLLDHYAQLVNSGDCGFWNIENENEVIASRAAIAEATS